MLRCAAMHPIFLAFSFSLYSRARKICRCRMVSLFPSLSPAGGGWCSWEAVLRFLLYHPSSWCIRTSGKKIRRVIKRFLTIIGACIAVSHGEKGDKARSARTPIRFHNGMLRGRERCARVADERRLLSRLFWRGTLAIVDTESWESGEKRNERLGKRKAGGGDGYPRDRQEFGSCGQHGLPDRQMERV